MEWYKSTYCNRRDWILENLESLSLDIDEAMFCILIDYCNTNHFAITYDTFVKKLKIERARADELIMSLSSKGYLKIELGEANLVYDLSDLFAHGLEAARDANFDDIFSTFEKAFGRPLNNLEIEKLSDLSKRYDNDSLFSALRIADAYQKLSIAYIETVLKSSNGN